MDSPSNPLCFVIHHDQDKRAFARASCLTVRKGPQVVGQQELLLVVDDFRGNQDPYVWHNPWMYSYCLAHGLRNKITPGSILFFVYGDRAAMKQGKRAALHCDTVFVVEQKQCWDRRDAQGKHVTDIPTTLEPFRESAWDGHLKWPLPPQRQHPGVSYTYLARNVQQPTVQPFSFLPYKQTGSAVWSPYDLEPLIYDRWRDIPAGKKKATPGLAITNGAYSQPIAMPYDVGLKLYEELRDSADTLVLNILSKGKTGGAANC